MFYQNSKKLGNIYPKFVHSFLLDAY